MMADFKFVRALNGMTPQSELMTAGGAMEVGDIVVYADDTNVGPLTEVTKAGDAATRATMAGLCLGKHQEDGDAIADGDLIQVLPFTDDLILEGTQSDTLEGVGTAVDLDVTSAVQSVVTTATAPFARIYKIVDATAKTVQLRLLAD